MTFSVHRVALLTATVGMFWASAMAYAQANPPPTPLNVLLIISDDLRPELACYGRAHVRSPNIDALAARGVRFERAYCQYPVCNPSRVSLLTGLRPDDTGVTSNRTNFRTKLPDIVTLPQHFRSRGYFTASLGKIFHRGGTMEETNAEMDDARSWDVAKYFHATELGNTGEGRNLTGGKLEWCHWLAAEGTDDDQPDGQVAREAIAVMEANRDKPLFLAVGFHKPHDPFVAPKKYFDLYPPEKITLPQPPADQTEAPPSAFAQGAYQPAFAKFTERDKREFTRAYLAGTSFTDAQVGRVIDALNRLGLAERTVIIFLGDHGYHLGERQWWNKNTLFELSCRAPLVIVPPGLSKGTVSRRLVEFVDLYPTLIDLCGLPAPAHRLAGQSLRPLLDDPEAPWKEAAFTQVQRPKQIGRSVRTDRWRYTEWDDGRAGRELYDHETDPGENHNLAEDPAHADTMAKLQPLLRRGDGTAK